MSSTASSVKSNGHGHVVRDGLPFAQVSNRITGDASLSLGARMVYVRLAAYANIRGRNGWPGRTRLAEELSAHPRTVGKWLAELTDAGYVTVTPRYRADGSRTSSEYHLLDAADFPESREERRARAIAAAERAKWDGDEPPF